MSGCQCEIQDTIIRWVVFDNFIGYLTQAFCRCNADRYWQTCVLQNTRSHGFSVLGQIFNGKRCEIRECFIN